MLKQTDAMEDCIARPTGRKGKADVRKQAYTDTNDEQQPM